MILLSLEEHLATIAANTGEARINSAAKAANFVWMYQNMVAHWEFGLVCPGWVHLFLSSVGILGDKILNSPAAVRRCEDLQNSLQLPPLAT